MESSYIFYNGEKDGLRIVMRGEGRWYIAKWYIKRDGSRIINNQWLYGDINAKTNING